MAIFILHKGLGVTFPLLLFILQASLLLAWKRVFQSVAQLSAPRGENQCIEQDLLSVLALLSQMTVLDPGKARICTDGFYKGNCAFQGSVAT